MRCRAIASGAWKPRWMATCRNRSAARNSSRKSAGSYRRRCSRSRDRGPGATPEPRRTIVSNVTNFPPKGQPPVSPAKSAYFSPACGRLAQMLVAEAALTRSDLHIAAEYSERERMPLSDAIIDLGFIHEADTYALLAKATGMELVDLSSLTPSE